MNKKVKNATPTTFDSINFKSTLEVTVYKSLKAQGFDVHYEPIKYVIWKGFKPTITFYRKDKKTGNLVLDDKKIIDITYTPDFVFEYGNIYVIIEVKGKQNDVYPYKRKLFRKLLETLDTSNKKVLFLEIYNKKNIIEAINIIKNYDVATENTKVN